MPITAGSNPLELLLQQRSGAAPPGGDAAPGGSPAPNPLAPNPASVASAGLNALLARQFGQNQTANPQFITGVLKQMRRLSSVLLAFAGEQHPSLGKHLTSVYKSLDTALNEITKSANEAASGPGVAGPLSFSGAALSGAPYATPAARVAS